MVGQLSVRRQFHDVVRIDSESTDIRVILQKILGSESIRDFDQDAMQLDLVTLNFLKMDMMLMKQSPRSRCKGAWWVTESNSSAGMMGTEQASTLIATNVRICHRTVHGQVPTFTCASNCESSDGQPTIRRPRQIEQGILERWLIDQVRVSRIRSKSPRRSGLGGHSKLLVNGSLGYAASSLGVALRTLRIDTGMLFHWRDLLRLGPRSR